MNATPEEQRFAEESGQMFDQWSLPRMAGRVWGLLIVAEEPRLSSLELTERLGTSAASISSATRYLLQNQLIERVRVPGERREYFTFSPASLRSIYLRRIAAVADMHRMAERALASFEDRPIAHRRLQDMHDFYEWLELELATVLRRWDGEKGQDTKE
ncbi:MAG TPA: MarR family transcriptional regulator [Acidimicrobiia bacterium]|nr:MarR family transcriptional regulator [Acidimicrobiia bacterium]